MELQRLLALRKRDTDGHKPSKASMASWTKNTENQLWFDKLKEIIDQYQPDLIWHDLYLSVVPEAIRLKFPPITTTNPSTGTKTSSSRPKTVQGTAKCRTSNVADPRASRQILAHGRCDQPVQLVLYRRHGTILPTATARPHRPRKQKQEHAAGHFAHGGRHHS